MLENGMCLVGDRSWRYMECYDILPPMARGILRDNVFNVCPECFNEISRSLRWDYITAISIINWAITTKINDRQRIQEMIERHLAKHDPYYDRRAAERYGYGNMWNDWSGRGGKNKGMEL